MIRQYIYQDKKAGREIEDKRYITYEWILNKIKKQNSKCYMCGNIINIDINNNLNDNEKLTIDRINNDMPHFKINCKISCLTCNLSKKASGELE